MIMQMKAVAGDEMAWNRLLFKPVVLNSLLDINVTFRA